MNDGPMWVYNHLYSERKEVVGTIKDVGSCLSIVGRYNCSSLTSNWEKNFFIGTATFGLQDKGTIKTFQAEHF
jgi:hypothetical protein